MENVASRMADLKALNSDFDLKLRYNLSFSWSKAHPVI